ncbi:OmpA family protein [Paracrocinitomix mangrovi]|uniref:OmpA family protein n=1 Tax=Paracrocinitomix mangrovi TaxID=2862509 RepID=UPI001C8D3C45|nr:OmpA family protein [Paracrocinitomix mangrovi]UKN03239.1 OmpA family protein [Paracrocinitomix mangrovi]
MKNLAGLLMVLFVMPLPLQAQEKFDAQIFVSNFNDEGLANAEVKLYDTTGVFMFGGTTNQEGRFVLNMHPGKYQIKLFQSGELKKERLIDIPELSGRKIYNRVRIHVLFEERKVFTLEDLHFEYNSAEIQASSYDILDRLVDFLNYETDGKYEIGGHTDAIGSDKDNYTLSENRAQAVRQYLIDHGITADRLVAKGYGESKPIADNETDEGRAQNRRTEVRKLE